MAYAIETIKIKSDDAAFLENLKGMIEGLPLEYILMDDFNCDGYSVTDLLEALGCVMEDDQNPYADYGILADSLEISKSGDWTVLTMKVYEPDFYDGSRVYDHLSDVLNEEEMRCDCDALTIYYDFENGEFDAEKSCEKGLFPDKYIYCTGTDTMGVEGTAASEEALLRVFANAYERDEISDLEELDADIEYAVEDGIVMNPSDVFYKEIRLD